MPPLHGGFLPPLPPPEDGSTSASARRRHEHRIQDRLLAQQYVQLAPGVLVAWDNRPWRVKELSERPLELWPAEYERAFAAHMARWEQHQRDERPQKATWRRRPVVVVLVPAGDPAGAEMHRVAPANWRWEVLTEHYALCVACGELPPCSHTRAERRTQEAMARAEALMDIPAGHCLGCGEQITSRQRADRFPGPNLWRPDLPDGSAVFHARQECAGDARRYRDQWTQRGGQGASAQLAFPEA
ncbi:hypothetical protein [Streptomyces xiamenensis]|uniref:hypothetical protein n=1 Tax=Streptomyces xiamenensis TaxID=408015 RepID=UPI0035DD4241